MKYYACKYSLIQFAPFRETDEFANIGVLLACDDQRFFDFRIESQQTKRYTQFFHNLDVGFYKFAAKSYEQKLEEVQLALQKNSYQKALEVFDKVVQPREPAIRFGAPRVLLTTDPKQELEKLFQYYVRLGFTAKLNYKADYERHIKGWLNELNLVPEKRFKITKVGVPEYELTLPFVQTLDQKKKVIQPFLFNQATPTKLYQYADEWLGKFKRLKHLGCFPDERLFTVKADEAVKAEPQKEEALQKILRDLKDMADIAYGDDAEVKQQVHDFAR